VVVWMTHYNTKIKLIAVDFDGTVCRLQEAHYLSLNKALEAVDPKFTISEEEQVERFEGLSTKRKIEILVAERNFPQDKAQQVFNLKQELTAKAIEETVSYDAQLDDTFEKLRDEGYTLFIASNAIHATIEAGLKKLGIFHHFHKILSNEDVALTKPHPEIFLKAMIEAGADPAETLIIEDSKNGRHSAVRSGAHVCDVDHSGHTTYTNIKATIKRAEAKNKPIAWSAKQTVNVLLPCAGMGSRLRAKYQLPKPLIDIAGKPMIQRVVEDLNIEANYIFIVQQEHYDQYNLGAYLKLIVPGCTILCTNGLTEGAACTSLLAKELIDNDKHLLIANSDQLLDWDSSSFMYQMLSSNSDGGILTFERENDPKWSYVKLDAKGHVCELAEKKPISNKATVGIYYFNKGSDYVKAAEEMIAANDRSNGEYYIAPVYNYMIKDQKKITTFDIAEDKFHPTGTIEDLEKVLTTLTFED
jgi:HAD superfamily hydrolase (TIGR01509 family)